MHITPSRRAPLAVLALALAACAGSPSPQPSDAVRVVVADSVTYKFVAAASAIHDTICVTNATPPVQVPCAGTPPIPPDTTTPTPPATGSPDPSQLPRAEARRGSNMGPMLVDAYDALNVRDMPAGGTYADPVTKVVITKLTSSTFPGAASWGLPYFEGGTIGSYPDADGKRWIYTYGSGGAHRIFEWTPGSAPRNARNFPAAGTPAHDLCFAFSTNPATPYYAYALTTTSLVRIDVRTMTVAPGDGFPVAGAGDGGWLQNSENDGAFVWMATQRVHYAEPARGVHRNYSAPLANEPRLARGGRYIGLSMNAPQNGLTLLDASSDPISVVYSQGGGLPFAHNASLKDLWIGSAWNQDYPFPFTSIGVTAGSSRVEWKPSIGDLPVWNGAWLQAGNQRSAWVVGNSYGSLAGCGSFCELTWTAPGGIVMVTMAGGASNARLVAYPYSSQRSYAGSAWPQFTSDGKFVLFASDMNGSSRYDLFIATMPLAPSR